MPDFLTTRQLQEILHVDRTTIYRMAEDGRLPAVKVGSQWRFPRRSVESWLKTQSSVVVDVDVAAVATRATDLDKLLPIDCVQKIQDTFADLLGVMIAVTELNGRPITRISHPCGLLSTLESSPYALSRCFEEWARLANAPSLQPAWVRGPMGLQCARGLVRVGAEIRAMLVVGGVAPSQWPPASHEIARLAEYFDVNPETMLGHINEVYTLNSAEKDQALAFVQRIADIVAHIATERNLLFSKLQHIAELSQF